VPVSIPVRTQKLNNRFTVLAAKVIIKEKFMEQAQSTQGKIQVERYPDDNGFIRGTVGLFYKFLAKVTYKKTRHGINSGRVKQLAIFEPVFKEGHLVNNPLAAYDYRGWVIQAVNDNAQQLVDTIVHFLEEY